MKRPRNTTSVTHSSPASLDGPSTRSTDPGDDITLGAQARIWNPSGRIRGGLPARGGDCAFALVAVAATVAVAIALLTTIGPEARGVEYSGSREQSPEGL